MVIDLLILLACIAYAIGSGLRAQEKASQEFTGYFLVGKTQRGRRVGFSMAATQFAVDTPLWVCDAFVVDHLLGRRPGCNSGGIVFQC